jgi:hypothetical protein
MLRESVYHETVNNNKCEENVAIFGYRNLYKIDQIADITYLSTNGHASILKLKYNRVGVTRIDFGTMMVQGSIYGHVEVIKYAASMEVGISEDNFIEECAEYAISTGNIKLVEFFCTQWTVLNSYIELIMIAIEKEYMKMFICLLSRINKDDEYLVLYDTLEYNRPKMFKYILNHGSDISTFFTIDPDGGLLINCAIRCCELDIITTLIQHGCKPNKEHLTMAINNVRDDIFGYLLTQGLSVNDINYSAILKPPIHPSIMKIISEKCKH